MAASLIASVELGGTKVVCGLAHSDAPSTVIRQTRFATADPDSTFVQIGAFLDEASADGDIAALGIASFGPVNADPGQDRYGWITATPKPGWADTSLIDGIPTARALPHVVMSDVTAAALAEQRAGAAQGARNAAYLTVGTGIGGGVVIGGRPVHGNGFPEAGHVLVRRHPDDEFAGTCPFHGDCAEGLAAGPAAAARWGRPLPELTGAQAEAAADILAFYIAQVVHDLNIVMGAERVVVGGGVTHLAGVREGVDRWLGELRHGGYGVPLEVLAPAFADAGLIGGLLSAAALETAGG